MWKILKKRRGSFCSVYKELKNAGSDESAFKVLKGDAGTGSGMTIRVTSSRAYGIPVNYKPRIFRSRACP